MVAMRCNADADADAQNHIVQCTVLLTQTSKLR